MHQTFRSEIVKSEKSRLTKLTKLTFLTKIDTLTSSNLTHAKYQLFTFMLMILL